MDVETWQSRLRAENTRLMYMKALRAFLAFSSASSEQSLTWTVDEAESRMIEWKEHLISSGLSGRSVMIGWAGVKRWFVDNRIRIVAKCEHVSPEKTYLDYIPTQQDVQLILDDCSLRLRLAVALMAFSGMRPADIVELQYRHVRKSFEHTDDVTTVIKQQKKTHQWYFTFLGPQGTRYLRSVLEMREKAGETISDDSYLLMKMGKKMTAGQLKRGIRHVIRRRFSKHPTSEPFRLFRPYGLRKYFRRVVSKLGEDTAEFLMGHSSGLTSLTATYSGLRDMDAEAISSLKEQYISLLGDLETETSEITVRRSMTEFDAMKRELERISAMLDEREKRRRG